MQRRTIGAALWLCAALSGALAVSEAYAQPAAQALEQAKAEAKEAATRGQTLYDQGSYEEAIKAFREAEQKFHAPTFLLMIARAHEKTGRLLAARAYYQQVVAERLANYAPKVFFEAQEQAKKELEALAPRIPTLAVTAKGAPVMDRNVILDGKSVTLEMGMGAPMEVDPGEHTVTVEVPGRAPATTTVTVREAERAAVTLELKAPPPPPPAVSPAPQSPPSVQLSDQTETPSRGYMVPAIGAFSVAGVALGVGVVTGALSIDATGALDDECVGKICYDDRGGDTYLRAKSLATVSTVGFVIGGVAAAAGVTLLLWPRPGGAQAQAAVRVAPGRVEVQGRF